MARLSPKGFLREVWIVSLLTFGGSEVHFPVFIDRFVRRRRAMAMVQLVELQSLCQCLPGPTSTQMLVALAYRHGGGWFAYLTLLIWCLPAVLLMTALAVCYHYFSETRSLFALTRWINPIMVAILFHASVLMGRRLLKTPLEHLMAASTAVIAFAFPYVYVYPTLLLCCGLIASRTKHTKPHTTPQTRAKLSWKHAWIWGSIWMTALLIGHLFHVKSLLVFENFYRNGSLIFGGGYAMIAFFFSEFVEQKQLISASTFLSGFAFAQVLPGPIFSFSAYVGFFTLPDAPLFKKILMAFLAAFGAFMPGVFAVLLAVPVWDRLKQHASVQAALKGVYAACSGLVLAISALLFKPLCADPSHYVVLGIALVLLFFARIQTLWLIMAALALGMIPWT